MVRILFVDDDPNIHAVLQMALPGECAVIPALTGAEGVRLAAEEDPDLVLLDIGLPDINGMDVLRRILALPAPPPVIMLTVDRETEKVVQAMKAGAQDYIVKPFNREKVYTILRTAIRLHVSSDEPSHDGTLLQRIIGRSPAIRKVKHLVTLYATVDYPVLIAGETGTGKELVARTIHEMSKRGNEVYIPLNCGAIPETLMESELFGAEKGAFTDAVARAGVFERANRGTLFLDEVGDMTPRNQVKLLRVIEDKSFTRVGGVRTIESDARIIAATNRVLGETVKAGLFRRDLYYRINTLPLEIPPLRQRKVDIPEIARAFTLSQGEKTGKPVKVAGSAIEKLMDHDWPGNIRELINVIERALLFAGSGRIEARHIVFG